MTDVQPNWKKINQINVDTDADAITTVKAKNNGTNLWLMLEKKKNLKRTKRISILISDLVKSRFTLLMTDIWKIDIITKFNMRLQMLMRGRNKCPPYSKIMILKAAAMHKRKRRICFLVSKLAWSACFSAILLHTKQKLWCHRGCRMQYNN